MDDDSARYPCRTCGRMVYDPEGHCAPITDPEDEYWSGCTEECPDDCQADHKGEE